MQMTKPAFRAGFDHVLYIYKPNSVIDSYLSRINVAINLKRHSPILPTEGGAKLSVLSEAKDLLNTINFVPSMVNKIAHGLAQK